MIDNIISYLPYAAWCFGGALVGMGTMAVLTMGKLADLRSDELLVDYFDAEYERAAHDRCADALTTCQRKLSAIRDLLDTPRTIRKGELAAVLDGEQA